MGEAEGLQPFADKVNYNFQQWTFRRNAGAVHFTSEQMEWLQLVKDHIATSLSIQPDDLDLSPFDRKGGLGRFYDCLLYTSTPRVWVNRRNGNSWPTTPTTTTVLFLKSMEYGG